MNPPEGLREERLGDLRQNKSYEKWNARFKELLDYRSEHGDCNVPQRQGKLGNWVSWQRQAYTAGSLAQNRIDRLSSIGFKWALRVAGPTVPWDTRFDELVRYKTKLGDCNVPASQGKLGTWVVTQRMFYKADTLAQVRIDRLNGIGFKWALREVAPPVPWDTRYYELVQYKANQATATYHGVRDSLENGLAISEQPTWLVRSHEIASIGSVTSTSSGH